MSKDIKFLITFLLVLAIIGFIIGITTTHIQTVKIIRSSETGEDITYAVCKEVEFEKAMLFLDGLEWKLSDNFNRVILYLDMRECGYKGDQYIIERNY